ncbi:hypothetical protein GALMADRAFT_230348 [Galerina marginata CBS 339.88]|uniref:Alpha-type protein kinase domain-containing protein n=1 Tax=Galerina marginata (strain CBS 339.88) TaxID=685588 RepID=A0A067SQS9_GALM3|nr:hypothetical protein GALMADRAFT_230348 [Galerina marginata CBS 339.88]
MEVIVDDFTEQVNSDPLIRCEGQSGCKAVLKQSEAQPIHNQNFTVSKKVCPACLTYYRSKKTTVVRQRPERQISPELSQIRRDVNSSQRQGAHAPGNRVSAMPPDRMHGMMRPPPTIPGPVPVQGQMLRTAAMPNYTTGLQPMAHYATSSNSQGADAVAPTAQQLGAFFNVPPQSQSSISSAPPGLGYSTAHAHYASELQLWRGKAAGRLGLNLVPINVTAARQVEKGKGYEELPLLREGFRIPEDISHFELIHQMIIQLEPGLKSYCQSHVFVFDTMIARETIGWIRVDPSFGDQRFFDEGRFQKKKGAKSANTTKSFQPPSKPVDFLLIIDIEQVRKIDACLDAEFARELEEEKLFKQQQAIVAVRAQAHHQDLKRKAPPPSPEKIAVGERPRPRPKQVKKVLSLVELPKEVIEIDDSADEHTPTASHKGKAKAKTSTIGASLRDAIKRGGTVNNYTAKLHDDVTERVIYYPVPHELQLSDLIEMVRKNELSIKDEKNAIHGILRYSLDEKSLLGSGAFKTSNLCVLTPINKLSTGSGLGHSSTHDGHDGSKTVAMKRPFFRKKKTGNTPGKVGRFALLDEGQQVMTEALLLLWATALHKLSYDFIDGFLAKSGPPPFTVPRLRFVYGALAFAQSDLTRAGTSTVSNRAVFLLEELISNDELPFEKYVHNADAMPLSEAGDPRYDTGVFLCFLQHIQYWKTEGLVYTSDYQGGATLLTDPQLMTSPSLGGDLFGDGNVSQVVEEFPQKHECNKYCKWFQLGPVSEALDDCEEGEIKEVTK